MFAVGKLHMLWFIFIELDPPFFSPICDFIYGLLKFICCFLYVVPDDKTAVSSTNVAIVVPPYRGMLLVYNSSLFLRSVEYVSYCLIRKYLSEIYDFSNRLNINIFGRCFLILNSKPRCQTLSKTWATSRNIVEHFCLPGIRKVWSVENALCLLPSSKGYEIDTNQFISNNFFFEKCVEMSLFRICIQVICFQ